MMAGQLMDFTQNQQLYMPTNGIAETTHNADFVNNGNGICGGVGSSVGLVSGGLGGVNGSVGVAGIGAGSVQDAEEEEEDVLRFSNASFAPDLLAAMGHLRRQNQFCDAVLRVGEREVSVHRAVLAASSPYLLKLFERTMDGRLTERPHSEHGLPPTSHMYKLKDVSFPVFSYLLDYMYSGRLSVAALDVGEVYRTAKLLRMEQVAQACSAFLVDHLTPANCLGIRMLSEDLGFQRQVDGFIQHSMDSVISSKRFYGLPELKVELIGAEEAMESGGQEGQLFSLVLDWARSNVDTTKPKVDHLTEQVNVLYLNTQNRLQDAKDVEDSRMPDDDVVTDYKKHSRRRSTLTNKSGGVATPLSEQSPQKMQIKNGVAVPFHVFNINPEGGVTEKEWSIIATIKQKGQSYMGLAVLSGKMMAVSIHLRPMVVSSANAPVSPGGARGEGVVVVSAVETVSGDEQDRGERCATLKPFTPMASSRCAFGVCVWNNTIVVCGGYDRGECLKSVEVYSPAQGQWSRLPDMLHPRARFGASAVREHLYAIGGSDGTRDLNSVHSFSFNTNKWSVSAPLQTARSSVGVAEVCGQVYCVGGSDGQRSLKTCEVYDRDTNRWTYIAPLNTARIQASVTCYLDSLIAVGGTDSWNCLSSVEMYQPTADAWTHITALSTVRRGAGIDVMDDCLWVVGGSDGASSLRSSEVYDAATKAWSPGPCLNTPRANVCVVGLNGALYALGGFSGKKFLNTLEILETGSSDWCLYRPGRRQRKGRMGSADSSGDEVTSASSTPLTVHSDSDDVSTSDDHEANSSDEAKLR